MSWSWYGVKTIYETTVSLVSPRQRKGGKRSERLVEERVVLFKARTADEAIVKAEAEARRYTQGLRYRNQDGNLVKTSYLGAADAFSIGSEPTNGREVYSSHRLVRDEVRDREVLDILLGPADGQDDEARRKYEPAQPID